MGSKKNLEKLLREPQEMTISEVMSVLELFSYRLMRIKGSHFHFKKPNGQLITVPVHRKKVYKSYLKKVKRIILNLPLRDDENNAKSYNQN